MLEAAMAAPSAGNEQPWEFIVIAERPVLEALHQAHPHASMLLEASVAIAVCGDTRRERHPGMWVEDCSAATENILLEAENLGLGAVWLGVYPHEERVISISNVLGLPPYVVPLSLVAVGHPAEHKPPSARFDAARVHHNRW
jgi:nitroreductase